MQPIVNKRNQVTVKRKNITFHPNSSRVIARFLFTGEDRALNIIRSVLSLPLESIPTALSAILRDFSLRHRNISKIFDRHYERITYLLPQINIDPQSLAISQKLLIGSYFTMEYSIESAAFFNPSVVEHPDQSEIGADEKRVIFSFRATGEGHISSIVFRTGILDKNNDLAIEPLGKLMEEAEHIRRHVYDKDAFIDKLKEMESFNMLVPPDMILGQLKDEFTYGELWACIEQARKSDHLIADKELMFNQILWLASSHYELDFSWDTNISERVIFPVSVNERNGIEDARFVKFTDDEGESEYYATYTAYDGIGILPKMLWTKDFYHFKVFPLHGEVAQNKGMALFPRKVNGKYAMLCRLNGYSNFISFSDNLTVWHEATLLQEPKFPWEFVQMGNCGSPIETSKGWLIITHGVGPVREYVLGASLLDLEDPTKVIGRLESPLISPNATEREGYVPNVVYSCGSMIHNGDLIIPYAMSDYASTYATINLEELLERLLESL